MTRTDYHLTSRIEQLRYEKHAAEVCKYIPYEGSVVDLGCGFGTLMLMVRGLRPDVNITGVDLNDHGIFWDKYAEIGIGFIKSDALDTGLKGHSFDVVISSGLMEHVDGASFLKEVKRLLKPGGHNIVFNIPNKYGLGENLSYLFGLVKKNNGEVEKRYMTYMLESIFGSNDIFIKKLWQEGIVPAQFGLFGRRIESFMNWSAKFWIVIDRLFSWLPFSQSFNVVSVVGR